MPSDTQNAPVSKKGLWAGRIMSTLVILFLSLFFDVVFKFLKAGSRPPVVGGRWLMLGWSLSLAPVLGNHLIGVHCPLCHPRSRPVLGRGPAELAIFGGGRCHTLFRVGDPLFSHVLFPTYLGVLLWGRSLPGRDGPLAAHSFHLRTPKST